MLEKVGLMIGEEPSPFFYSKIFSKFQVIVEEVISLLPRTCKLNLCWISMQPLGARSSSSMIVPHLNILEKLRLCSSCSNKSSNNKLSSKKLPTYNMHLKKLNLGVICKATADIATAREDTVVQKVTSDFWKSVLAKLAKINPFPRKLKMEAVKEWWKSQVKLGKLRPAAKMNQIQALNDEEAVREDIESQKPSNHLILINLYGVMGRLK